MDLHRLVFIAVLIASAHFLPFEPFIKAMVLILYIELVYLGRDLEWGADE